MNKPPTSSTPSRPPPYQGEELTPSRPRTCQGEELSPSQPSPCLGEELTPASPCQKVEAKAPSPDKGRVGVGSGVDSRVKLNNLKYNKTNRQKLRKNPTEPEKQFWSWVRAKQLGVKFRRQHGLGRYIVDFYCAELKLVIELDGDSHFTPQGIADDAIRNEFLNSFNLKIIRFTNEQIMQEKEGLLTTLQDLILTFKKNKQQ